MAELSTTYMGLDLRNPLIVGSSGLTNTLENLQKIDKKGAGAVVLKSLFEEQITHEIRKVISSGDYQNAYTEAEDYIKNYARTHTLNEYTNLIQKARKSISIPVIASINCVSDTEWTSFAKDIQEAGADAIELNIFLLPSDIDSNSESIEKVYFDIIKKVRSTINIPISLKISSHFSGLAEVTKKLSWTGIKGLVLFNRFFNIDFDINGFKMKPGNLYSSPEEITNSLRWIAILSDRIQCDLCASTGIHDGSGLIKQILAGAKAGQVCSVLYKNGFDVIEDIINELNSWMDDKKFKKVEDFRGKMSYKKTINPSVYHRVQFMKHFAGIE